MKTKAKAKTDSPLISFQDAGELLGLHANTIRQRGAGTENLTHVDEFGRRVFLIRSEVEDLLAAKIATAQDKERKRQKLIASMAGRRRRRRAPLAIAS